MLNSPLNCPPQCAPARRVFLLQEILLNFLEKENEAIAINEYFAYLCSLYEFMIIEFIQ